MAKDPKIYLEHILESIEAIENYAQGQTIKTFLVSERDQDAVIRRLEIIGEAVKNIPDEFKDKHSEIPWQKIAGMRDVLIHEYFVVDIRAVWDTIQDDLPRLKEQIKHIIQEF
ncbi:MAG: DUF86 domain-containing protein [Candidatus Sungbacteria bacterium]|nr:DUF86 domain-containing protein [Candidatus Sungbacteria bacterium]